MTTGYLFKVKDMVGGYVDVVRAVMEQGDHASPRGQLTKELLAVTIVVPASAPVLPVGTNRKVNTRLAAVEALQVVGGYSDPGAFAEWPHMERFMDNGAFHGAYGPRVRPQLDLVVRRLTEDPQSRRAVVTIWDPLRDSVEGVQNYPCTTELQFMVRNMRLDLHVTMRANDAWHGLAYDVFMFSQLQATVARMLGRAVGTYAHHATSLHVYEEHWALTRDLVHPEGPAPFTPYGFSSPQRARLIGDGRMPFSSDPSEAWYIEKTARREAAVGQA